jgi:hypothetical protein
MVSGLRVDPYEAMRDKWTLVAGRWALWVA